MKGKMRSQGERGVCMEVVCMKVLVVNRSFIVLRASLYVQNGLFADGSCVVLHV